jgi:hypothetical protein
MTSHTELSQRWPDASEDRSSKARKALTVIFVLCALLVFLPNQPWILELAIALLCPLLLWTAARLRPVFTAAAIFVWAFTIVWTTTFGVGIFGDVNLPIDLRIMSGQATILATSLGALVLAALWTRLDCAWPEFGLWKMMPNSFVWRAPVCPEQISRSSFAAHWLQ